MRILWYIEHPHRRTVVIIDLLRFPILTVRFFLLHTQDCWGSRRLLYRLHHSRSLHLGNALALQTKIQYSPANTEHTRNDWTVFHDGLSSTDSTESFEHTWSAEVYMRHLYSNYSNSRAYQHTDTRLICLNSNIIVYFHFFLWRLPPPLSNALVLVGLCMCSNRATLTWIGMNAICFNFNTQNYSVNFNFIWDQLRFKCNYHVTIFR